VVMVESVKGFAGEGVPDLAVWSRVGECQLGKGGEREAGGEGRTQ
jgi:hypothetical protein